MSTNSAVRTTRILIIDDDAALLVGLADMLRLRLWRIEVDTCEDPAHAVEMVKSAAFDLILCDVCMPCITGLELLPALREAAPSACIVMMSGDPWDKTVQARAATHGVTTFLPKPFDRQAVTTGLKALLNQYHHPGLDHRPRHPLQDNAENLSTPSSA